MSWPLGKSEREESTRLYIDSCPPSHTSLKQCFSPFFSSDQEWHQQRTSNQLSKLPMPRSAHVVSGVGLLHATAKIKKKLFPPLTRCFTTETSITTKDTSHFCMQVFGREMRGDGGRPLGRVYQRYRINNYISQEMHYLHLICLFEQNPNDTHFSFFSIFSPLPSLYHDL